MTWDELHEQIKSLTPEQRKKDVAIFDPNEDEYHACFALSINMGNDVLDENHPYLILNTFPGVA